jgi:type II secretory pathway component PulF
MKLSKFLSAVTWYLVFFLIIGFVIAVQVIRAGIEVHWSDLILITTLSPLVPTFLVMWVFPSDSEGYKGAMYS